MFQVYGMLSLKHLHEFIWNRTVLLRSGLGNHIPLDSLLEFYNRLLNVVLMQQITKLLTVTVKRLTLQK